MENPTIIVAKERMEPAVAGMASKAKTEEASCFPPIPVRKMKAVMVNIPAMQGTGQMTYLREKNYDRNIHAYFSN